MNTAYLDKEHFQQNDISTRLAHLAAHLTQIQSLTNNKAPKDKIARLMRQSLYFIEWTVPSLVEIDVDKAAELVDLGRTIARWQHNWNKICAEAKNDSEITDTAGKLSERVREIRTVV
ncbi:MAG: hypothetical protein HC836_39540 [Richelia sp. RM2_1_2]|nr:hypothetical protein [Richelia sp. SM2_1_7]NJM23467.1 hypothetical protein [Richelia sp. SM1_7_0]NJO27272.1 hypothetical protein [Richelia sp. SL_2_1]NJO64060.1 hypothetical protein [Richelia sp. RM2_1_2]NJR19724.1 hypothetical protein [Calothrix sp. CSU_2_0]